MPAKPKKAPKTYEYRKIALNIHVSPTQYDALAAYCLFNKVKGRAPSITKLARHLLLEKVVEGEALLKRIAGL